MANRQPVMIKGQLDGISITLNDGVEFDVLKEDLRKKVSRGRRFFEGSDTAVSFKGRVLTENEEQSLIDIIIGETSMDVTFVKSAGFNTPLAMPGKPERPSVPKIMTLAPPGLNGKESNTTYYKGGLRSGQSIKYNGSIVIMGDVNPGSEVVAGGNVVVLGALKGMAHAGAHGDNTCYIAALDLRPTQVRIADIISYVPAVAGKKASASPGYAYINHGQVFVAPL